MTREYGALLRLGLVVPPANATVEPEMAALLPKDAAIHAARLPGIVEQETGRGLDARIRGYLAALPDVVRSFGGMALDAICLMHTGCSYVVGTQGEAGLREALDRAGAGHAFTAAGAVEATLAALGCRRIALVLPYPEWLCEAAVAYWEARGFTVAGVEKPRDVVSIYEIAPEDMIEAARRLDLGAADAILLSGTGPPTLRALAAPAPGNGIPILSSNQCVAWQALSRVAAAGAALPGLSPPLRDLADRLAPQSG